MTFGISAATLATVGGSIAGGLIAANAAGDAADTQAGASDRATQAQRDMFERQVQLQEPWRQAGMGGLNELLLRMGITPPAGAAASLGTSSPADGPTDPVTTAYRELLNAAPTPEALAYYQGGLNRGIPLDAIRGEIGAHPSYGVTPLAAPAPTAANTPALNPLYGSLLAPAPEFKPFSLGDFQADPGYQFRLSEGQKALERARSASGSLGSGKYLKDLTAYNQGQAAQEYGNAFQRYNANQDAIYNRFNTNQNNQYNRLASLAGLGQTATNTLTSAAGNFGQQIGSNIIGAGNAAAAGQVGTANAINSGIGQGLSMYSQQNMLNQLLQQRPYPASIPGPGTVGDFPMTYYG